jgi:4-hydroxy-4-methyl-2-oxoglutarate aldolase
MRLTTDIIDYIKKNRVSTTEVADALNKTGAIDKLKPINNNNNIHKVGKVKCIFASYESNFYVHDQIQDIKEDEIPFIITYKCKDKAIIGDLITKFLILYKDVNAILVSGNVRDVAKLLKENYPIWCEGSNPIGCVNHPTKSFPKKLQENYKKKYDGAIAICDSGGVVMIENSKINKDTLKKIKALEVLEDIWYFCLDNLKWTTKEIVCEKKYMKNKNIFSPSHLDSVKKYLK